LRVRQSQRRSTGMRSFGATLKKQRFCEKADVSIDELSNVIGDHHTSVLWACVFEDLLTRDLADSRNIVDDYLKRRGWKESVSNKVYMTALRSSVMSLYEISEHCTGRVVPSSRSGAGRRTGTGERAIGDTVSQAVGSDRGTYRRSGVEDRNGRVTTRARPF
jgi:hypothetical protein